MKRVCVRWEIQVVMNMKDENDESKKQINSCVEWKWIPVYTKAQMNRDSIYRKKKLEEEMVIRKCREKLKVVLNVKGEQDESVTQELQEKCEEFYNSLRKENSVPLLD